MMIVTLIATGALAPTSGCQAGLPAAAHATIAAVATAGTRELEALALKAWASATSGSYAAWQAVDGNTDTSWQAWGGSSPWLAVDCGASSPLTGMTVKARPGQTFAVQVSDDAWTWRTVLTTQTSTWGTENRAFPAGTSGRYLRLGYRAVAQTVMVFEVQPQAAAATPAPSPSPNATATPAPSATPTPAPSATAATGPALYVSPTGNDTNAGTTPDAPLQTIAAASGRATPGTTINLAGGTYHEQLITRAAGLPGQEITYQSYNGTAVLDGSTYGWTVAGDQNQALVLLNHAYNHLKGLKIVNSKDSGVVLNADNLTVEGCEIAEIQRHGISTNTGRQTGWPGISGTNIRNAVLVGNNLYHCTLAGNGNGQAVSLIADGFTVANNQVHDNQDIGIDIWLGAKHGEVSGNTCYNNALSSGIYVDGASYVRIDRNRVFGNKTGIGISSECPYYATQHIWAYDNVVTGQSSNGCFIWDDPVNPGVAGCQDVLFAHNTLASNPTGFYFAGTGNTADVMNNLIVGNVSWSDATGSTITMHDNVALASATGFADAASGNYALVAGSPAIDKGAAEPTFADDLGHAYTIDVDFPGNPRVAHAAPDAGAYELP